MGWASGNELLSEIIHSASFQQLSHKARVGICLDMIQAFENHDCDTLYELYGEGDQAFDDAYRALYPEHAAELDDELNENAPEEEDEEDE